MCAKQVIELFPIDIGSYPPLARLITLFAVFGFGRSGLWEHPAYYCQIIRLQREVRKTEAEDFQWCEIEGADVPLVFFVKWIVSA